MLLVGIFYARKIHTGYHNLSFKWHKCCSLIGITFWPPSHPTQFQDSSPWTLTSGWPTSFEKKERILFEIFIQRVFFRKSISTQTVWKVNNRDELAVARFWRQQTPTDDDGNDGTTSRRHDNNDDDDGNNGNNSNNGNDDNVTTMNQFSVCWPP